MISPFSVLFGAGSAVEATSNKDDAGDIGSDGEMVVDESSNDVDQDNALGKYSSEGTAREWKHCS